MSERDSAHEELATEFRGDEGTISEILADGNFGANIAMAIRSPFLKVLHEAIGPAFLRCRWPTTPGYDFEASVSADAVMVVTYRDRGGDSMTTGPGAVRRLNESFLPPRAKEHWAGWHRSLRDRFKLREIDAVLVLPMRVRKPEEPPGTLPWNEAEMEFLFTQIRLNAVHHCRALGLPRPRVTGIPQEPRPGSAEASFLAALRANRDRFMKLPDGDRLADRLRGHGFKIESARQARAAGKDAPVEAVGWRLLD